MKFNEDIYVFGIQDDICGGLILANSEEEARGKLSKQRGIHMSKDIASICKLREDMFDEFGVIDLW